MYIRSICFNDDYGYSNDKLDQYHIQCFHQNLKE